MFTNPDFEGDGVGAAPSGWTRQNNLNPGITDTRPNPQTLASLNLGTGGVQMTFVVGGVPESQTDPDLGTNGTFRFPKYGTRATRVNYQDAATPGKNKNVNVLRQEMTISQADVDPLDGLVHVRFTVAPILENPAHAYTQQPYYFVRLQNTTTNTTVYQDFATAGQTGVPWKTFTDASGNPAEYVDWGLADIAPGNQAIAIGDKVELLVLAAGCSLGGHWGRVYLDSFMENIPGLYTWSAAPQVINAGASIVYRVNYRNGGTTTTSGTKLDFATPPNTTFVSTTGTSCTTPTVGATGTVSCPLGTLAPNADGSFTITVNVPSATATGTVITNGNYSIYATNVSPLIGSKTYTTVTAAATAYSDVRVTATDNRASIAWGQPTSYTITVSNSGPIAANTVTVTDTMPAQLTGVTWTCAAVGGAFCTAAGSGNISDAIAIPVGGVATYTVNATVMAGSGTGTIRNTVSATVSGGQTDPDTTSNTVVDTTAVGDPAVLTVTKTTPAALGTVRSTPSGLTCDTSCTSTTATFNDSSQVILDASPVTGATFVSWTGACSGNQTTCTVTMTGAQSAGATFAGPPAASVGGGGGQRTQLSTAFAQPLTVTVTDASGTPVPGVPVSFGVPGSGASATLSATSATTDASGVAQVTATANATPGAYDVTATVPGVATPASFALSNLGPPATVTVTSGSGQTATVNTGYAAPLIVTVRDAVNQVLPNVSVTFTGPASGASELPTPTTLLTDGSGNASLAVAANTIAGAYSVLASVSGVATPATFTLTNTAGAGAVLTVVSGDGQSATVNTAFAAPFVAQLVDAFGNPVANATVTFAAPASGATATLSTPATTDGNGQTSVTGVASTTIGAFSITASSTGANTATFIATATAGAPASVVISSGDNQTPTVNATFTDALVVTVLDAFGNPVPGVTVAFSAPGAGASASVPPTATSNAAGQAFIAPTAGTVTGTYQISATVTGVPAVNFTATNVPGAPASIAVQSGDNQNATVNTAFAAPLVAQVIDAFGNPVPGVSVAFGAPASGARATLSPSTVTSDAAGLASTTATAGTVTGAYSVTAQVPGGPSATYSLTNDPGAAATLTVVSGSPQSATVNAAFGAPLIVEVRDGFGNLVPGASIDFTVPSSGPSATPSAATATSDAQGRAQITATAGTEAGTYNVTATISGQSRTFALTNTAGDPATVALISGDNQTAPAATPFADPLVVLVRDGFNNAVPGATIAFSVPAGSASATLGATTVTTNASGRASVTATAKTVTATYAVTATVAGLPPLQFTLTNAAGPPATISVISGGNQSAEVAAAFTDPIVIEVLDAFGNVVPDQDVAFTPPATGASATVAATATTGPSGRAEVTATAGNVAGQYDVLASIAGVSTVHITFTNTPGPPTAVQILGGDGQTTAVLTPLGQPLTVRVVDALGNPVAGVQVSLSVPDPSGPTAELADLVLTTGSDGRATTTATSGRHAGTYDITASITGSTTAFHQTSVPGPAVAIRPIRGASAQLATVLTPFAVPLEVVVEDAEGNPVAGATVTFAGSGGSATAVLSASTVTTDANGLASVTATAGAVTGSYFATARVAGLSSVAFGLTNLPGAPTTIVASSGSDQSATVDTDFVELDALVLDAGGNPVPGAVVLFDVPASGATGTVTATSVASDANGHARINVHAGTVAGPYAITAMTSGAAAPARFALANTPGAPATMTMNPTSSPQNTTVDTGFTAPLLVIITDAFGNPVPGESVAFEVPATGATGVLSAPTAVTDARGRASVTVTANTTAGSYAATATATGLPPVTFELSNLTGATVLLSVRSGSPQTALVATGYVSPLIVHAEDSFGNPVVGATITFAAPATGASATLSPATAVTDASGDASTLATAGTVSGSFTVTATVPDGARPVAFPLRNRPGVPALAVVGPISTPQTTGVGTAFVAPLVVTVTDAFGNRVSGATVTFTVPSLGASATLSATTVLTGPDGTATALAIAGGLAGSYQVTVDVAGISAPLEFEMTNTSGNATTLVAVSGAGQHAMATTTFTAPLQLRVVDAFGNAIPSTTVMLETPGTGPSGTLSTASRISDSEGLVAVNLTANATPGLFQVSARISQGATPVRITLTIDPIPTTTVLETPARQSVDQPVLTNVKVTAAILVPAGDVEVLDSAGDVLGGATLSGAGTAQIAVHLGKRGDHELVARFRAQGAFRASNSEASVVTSTQDEGRLTGAGSDCSAGSGGGFGLILLAGGLLGRRRRPRPMAWLAALALVPALAGHALAQPAGARAIDRLQPGPADSEWFALDSVVFEGHGDVSVAVTGDYGYRPLVIYNADDSRRTDVVRHMAVLHVGASVSLYDQFRLSANVPVSPYQDGQPSTWDGMPLPQPTYAFGDVTISGDMRLAGASDSRFRAAIGVRLVTPTGSRTYYMSDGVFAFDGHGLVAGTLKRFEYAADLRLLMRTGNELASEEFGSEVRYAVAAGARLAGGDLVVGPELAAAMGFMNADSVGHAVEVGVGAHYRFADAWRLGLGFNLGLVHEVGTPEERAMLSLAWLP